MGFISSSSSSSSVGLHLYIVYSIVQNIQNLFRFRVGILPGLGWGISFGIQAQLECNIRYVHT